MDPGTQDGFERRRMDPRTEDGPESVGWARERRMDPRTEDGPESVGWARERRMDPRAEDGPESAAWTRECVMDSRGGDGLQSNRDLRSFRRPKKKRYEKKDRYDWATGLFQLSQNLSFELFDSDLTHSRPASTIVPKNAAKPKKNGRPHTEIARTMPDRRINARA